MICVRCNHDVEDGKFCSKCGWRQSKPYQPLKKRLNGEGTIKKTGNGKFRAVQRLLYCGEDGKIHEFARTKLCRTKEEAVAILPALKEELLRNHPGMGSPEA